MNQKLKRVVIKEELVEITGDYISAIVLGQFLYWTERTKDYDMILAEIKEMASKNDDENNGDFSYGWIYKSANDLSDETMLGLSSSNLRKYIKALVDKGFLLQRNNPKYKWDRTLQYKVNFTTLQKELQDKGYSLEGYKLLGEEKQDAIFETEDASSEIENGTSKTDNRSERNRHVLPEITTETTIESEKKLTTRSVLLQGKSHEESGKKPTAPGCIANDQRSVNKDSPHSHHGKFFDDDIHKEKYADFVYLAKTEKERFVTDIVKYRLSSHSDKGLIEKLKEMSKRRMLKEYGQRIVETVSNEPKYKSILSLLQMPPVFTDEENPIYTMESLMKGANERLIERARLSA